MRNSHHQDRDPLVLDPRDHAIVADPPAPETGVLGHRYLAEFDFRYSTKDISDRERADIALLGIGGKRLTYRRTDKLAA